MKFATMHLMANVGDMILRTIENCGPHVDAIYVGNSPTLWGYIDHGLKNQDDPEILKRSRWFGKVRLVEGSWKLDEEERIALPHMLNEGDKHFHLATLDGNHAFPNCFTDFQYMAEMLRIGGLILVDDVRDLWQCKLLSTWIKERRPDFQYREFVTRAAVFEKVADRNEDFHNQKPFKVSF